jgi:hypothetical protein
MRLIGITAVIVAIGFTASAGCQTAASQKVRSVTDRPAEASQSSLFGRLVGTWDVDYEIYDKDGNVRRYKGQAVYSWILDGGALQEIWTSDAHNKTPQPYSTTIDFYDKKRQSWTVVWIYPAQGNRRSHPVYRSRSSRCDAALVGHRHSDRLLPVALRELQR